MRYEYIDPFVSTTMRVLRDAVCSPISKGDVTVLQGDRIQGEVAVAIRITGDSEGDVIIGMDMATALGVSSLLAGVKFDTLTGEAADALGELGNMIAGNAVSALNDLGFDFAVEPPKVEVQAGAPYGYGRREALQFPLVLGCGKMTMNVLLGTD